MEEKRRNEGITLIALIITIIIMLILVTVSINIAISSGLFTAAGKGTKETRNAIGEEQKVAEGMIKVDGKIYESIEDYVAGEEKVTDLKNLIIGAPINYHEYIGEDGKAFSVMPSYTSSGEKNGYKDATFTVMNNSGIEWIVLGQENGQIKITMKNSIPPISGGYTNNKVDIYCRFQGKTGYGNYTEELNKIGSVYGQGKYADTSKYRVVINETEQTSGGRSMKMEDLGYEACERTAGYTYALEQHEGDTEAKVYRYAAGTVPDGTSTEGGTNTKFEYMALDANPNKIEVTEEADKEWKELNSENSSVTLYRYSYSGSQKLSTDISKSTSYHLASRNLKMSTDTANFAIYAMPRWGTVWGDNAGLYTSAGESFGENGYVRVIVYLKPDIKLSYNSQTGSYTIK